MYYNPCNKIFKIILFISNFLKHRLCNYVQHLYPAVPARTTFSRAGLVALHVSIVKQQSLLCARATTAHRGYAQRSIIFQL